MAYAPGLWQGRAAVKKGPDSSTEFERFLNCPKCNAVAGKTDALGRTVVYLRCAACGEKWSIPERRHSDRAARFPLTPPD